MAKSPQLQGQPALVPDVALTNVHPQGGSSPGTSSSPTLPQKLACQLIWQMLDEGLSVELQVSGSSMSPCIRSGDVITLSPSSAETLRLGEVVAVRLAAQRIVVHRVIRRDDDGIVTRGDANPGPDPSVDRQQVLARVESVVRQGRPLRLGLGAERRVIALLSRHGILKRCWGVWRRIRRIGFST